jgi:UPF0271 protein
MRVLDTAALLYWPVEQLADGVCAISQQAELERVSAQRFLLVQSLDSIQWRDVPPAWLQDAKEAAAMSGDLPRLSDVDVDVLALAIALDATLVTDDYRLQNTMQALQRPTKSVGTTGAKQVWRWELRCTGCRATSPVPANVDRSKKGSVADCDVCGSPMNIKRAR